jgi:hypothetical protein
MFSCRIQCVSRIFPAGYIEIWWPKASTWENNGFEIM